MSGRPAGTVVPHLRWVGGGIHPQTPRRAQRDGGIEENPDSISLVVYPRLWSCRVEAQEVVSTENVVHARDATPDCGDCGKRTP